MPSEEEDKPEEVEVRILVSPEHRVGVWANFAQVGHSPYEFTLDFARLEFDGDRPTGDGLVVSRVSMSPLFITQLIAALQSNYDQWAKKAMPPEVREHDDKD